MQLIITTVAVLMILAGAVVNRTRTEQPVDNRVEVNNEVSTEEPEVMGIVTTDQVEPSPTIVQSPTPSPTSTMVVEDVPNASFQYPESVTVDSTSGAMVLTSTDSANAITDWYKQRIRDGGMTVTSFVTTKTNGVVLNKLAGADGGSEINVEISKNASDSSVLIKIDY